MADLDKPTRVGMVLCAIPVAVYSAFSQFETGRLAHMPPALAWVLPVATDAAAYVATRVWLTEKYPKGVRRWAGLIVAVCVGLSLAGAALHLGLVSDLDENGKVRPAPGWLPFAVGATPSLVLAGLLHLSAIVSAAPTVKAEKSGRTVGQEVSIRKTRTKTVAPTTGAAEPVDTASAVPASKPAEPRPAPAAVAKPVEKPAPEVGEGSLRTRMLAYLDENGEVTGAELDRIFDTKSYGRGVLRAWRSRHPIASGE